MHTIYHTMVVVYFLQSVTNCNVNALADSDSPLLTAGSLPLPSLIPIGAPGGIDPNQVEMLAMPAPAEGNADGAPPLTHLNENPASKITPALGGSDSNANSAPTNLLEIALPGKNPHVLYWLPTGDELNGLEAETDSIMEANAKKKTEEEAKHAADEAKDEQEEEVEDASEEAELQKEDPLEKSAPIHGLRPFGWTPQLASVQGKSLDDPSSLNSHAFETLLLETESAKTLQRRSLRYKGPSMQDGWNIMQASTPFDDKDASYVMPSMGKDGKDVEIPTDDLGKQGGASGDIDGIEAGAEKGELGAASSIVGDMMNGFNFDVSGVTGRR